MTFVGRHALSLHLALLVGGFVALAAMPPTRGGLWLVPVTSAGRGRLVALAIANGARLVAPGRITGSMVVMGERSRLWRPMLDAGILTLGAGASGCAASRPTAEA